jgi:hypothetical protein
MNQMSTQSVEALYEVTQLSKQFVYEGSTRVERLYVTLQEATETANLGDNGRIDQVPTRYNNHFFNIYRPMSETERWKLGTRHKLTINQIS